MVHAAMILLRAPLFSFKACDETIRGPRPSKPQSTERISVAAL